jgi:hypothetical protein
MGLVADADIKKKLLLDWAMPEETILMSAMQYEAPTRSFCILSTQDTMLLRELPAEHYVRISFNERVKDSKYFVYDTTHTYTIASYNDVLGRE